MIVVDFYDNDYIYLKFIEFIFPAINLYLQIILTLVLVQIQLSSFDDEYCQEHAYYFLHRLIPKMKNVSYRHILVKNTVSCYKFTD
jgi:hypothetical protein